MFGKVFSLRYIYYILFYALNEFGQYERECVKCLMLCRPGLLLFWVFFLLSIWSLVNKTHAQLD